MASNSKTRKVTCGYCQKIMLYQNFADHLKLKHPGKPELYAGEKKITGWLAQKTKKRKISECEEAGDDVELGLGEANVVDDGQTDTVCGELSSMCAPGPSMSETKLDEILERVKDIQISISSEKDSSKSILPPLAKPQDVAVCDERIKKLLSCFNG